jgi:hypothetical protein
LEGNPEEGFPSKSVRRDWFPRGRGAIPAPTENHIFIGASAARARIANSAPDFPATNMPEIMLKMKNEKENIDEEEGHRIERFARQPDHPEFLRQETAAGEVFLSPGEANAGRYHHRSL